jgi:hypothetical protein
MIIRDIENLKKHQNSQDQTLRDLTDWISYLRNDNERHKLFISEFLVGYASSQRSEKMEKEFLKIIERYYGLRWKDGKFVSVEQARA